MPFVKFDSVDSTIRGFNQRVSNWAFSVSSYILVLRLGGGSERAGVGKPATVDPVTSGRGTGASVSMGVEVVGLKLALICLTSS